MPSVFDGFCCNLKNADISVAKWADVTNTAKAVDFVQIGNTEELTITPKINEVSNKNYRTSSAGNDCVGYIVESVDVSLKVACNKAFNIETFLGATRINNTASATAKTWWKYSAKTDNSVILFDEPIDLTTLVVKTATGTLTAPVVGAATLVLGVDYTILDKGQGILISNASAAVVVPGTYAPNTVNLQISAKTLNNVGFGNYKNASSIDLSMQYGGYDRLNNKVTNGMLFHMTLEPGQIEIINVEKFTTLELKGKLIAEPNFYLYRPVLLPSWFSQAGSAGTASSDYGWSFQQV